MSQLLSKLLGGFPGPTGPQGDTVTGPTGPQGDTVTGPTGPQGDTVTGPTGPAGTLQIISQITSSTTLDSSHANKYIPANSASAINFTINGSVFSANHQIAVAQKGAGIITIVQGSGGMTLNGSLKTWGQNTVLFIFFESATVATIIGGSA